MSRSFGATALTSRSSMRISPSLTVSSPAIIASNVDFPQPDGPTSATNSPSPASRSMPFSTSTAPKRLRSRAILKVAMPAFSFDRALRHPAHEIFAAEEIDQQRRHRGDDHCGAGDVIGLGVHHRRGQRHHGGGDRLLAPAGEHYAEQI